jgi:hypothetical protein
MADLQCLKQEAFSVLVKYFWNIELQKLPLQVISSLMPSSDPSRNQHDGLK